MAKNLLSKASTCRKGKESEGGWIIGEKLAKLRD